MLASSSGALKLSNRAKRKWESNENLKGEEQETAVTDNLQTPRNKRARREEYGQETHTPFGRVASWVRDTARKTARLFTSFRERFWRDEIDDEDEISPLPVYSDMQRPRYIGKGEVQSTQVQDEETLSHWRRKPLDENFSQYRLHQPTRSSRQASYNPSRYNSNTTTAASTRNELWPSSSSRHRDYLVPNDEVSVRRTEAEVVKPKASEKLQNKTVFKIKRHPTTVDNVVRLQEREEYMKLLAHYTKSVQPNYGTTGRRTVVVEDNEKRKPTVTSKSLRAEHSVMSSKSQSTNPTLPSTHEEIRHSVKVQASSLKMSSVLPESSRAMSAARGPKGIFELQSSSRSSVRSFDLLDDNWIKKWREALSADYLEQQRKIAKEQLKLEAIRKEKDEFERVQKEVKQRMQAKQESPVREEEVDSFQELTDQMNDIIDQALGHGSPGELLVELPIGRITRGDITTLRAQTWLNDEVVNAYFHLIAERSKTSGPKVHIFNTFFYPKLMKTGHASLRRWTKKVDLFAMDIILIPVHLGMHWCLAVIDVKRKTFSYYDSLKGENKSCIQALRDYICAESLDKKKATLDLTGWKNDSPKSIPEQLNGCDCGVFACKYAEYISRRATFNFTQHHMPYFRRRMVYEILKKKLL